MQTMSGSGMGMAGLQYWGVLLSSSHWRAGEGRNWGKHNWVRHMEVMIESVIASKLRKIISWRTE